MGFLNAGNDLATDGAIRIGGVNQVKVVGRDRGGQLGPGEENASPFFVAEGEVPLDVRERRNSILELPLGGIPIARQDVLSSPVSRSR